MPKVFKPAAPPAPPALQPAEVPLDLSATFVKWFIPTFGVLFTLIGFAVHTAHLGLLGFPGGEGAGVGVAVYSAEAADFLRHLVTLIGDRALALGSLQAVSLAGHGALLLGCAVAALMAVAYRLSGAGQRAPGRSAALLGLSVVVLMATKFAWFDAPTMRVESVIAAAGVADLIRLKDRDSDNPPSFASRLDQQAGSGLDGFIRTRTAQLWNLLVCSRLSSAALAENPDFGASDACRGDTASNQAQLEGEFDAAALLGVVIALACAVLLGVRKPAALAVAVLGLAYLLTVPYAYGKLIKSVEFPFALVRFSPGTLRSDEASLVATTAFVVARGAGELTVLEAVPEDCSVGQRVTLRFSTLPSARLIAIEQISRQDVITWAMVNARRCSRLDKGPLNPDLL